MAHEFDSGHLRRRYRLLVEGHPDESVYPYDAFRVEWGPVFHRGRLDGTARILVIGQDPATHEAITRRILVGEAGQRVQGLLARLGVTRSYVLINTFLYSVYGQGGGTRHIDDPPITRYRNRWIDAIIADQPIEAILTLGQLADTAHSAWRATARGRASTIPHVNVRHPTYPESSSRGKGAQARAEAFQRLCDSWNAGLDALHGVVTPDDPVPLRRYGATITEDDLARIPAFDLPPGLPPWMLDLQAWASRTGDDAQTKRATITVKVPTRARLWPRIA